MKRQDLPAAERCVVGATRQEMRVPHDLAVRLLHAAFDQRIDEALE